MPKPWLKRSSPSTAAFTARTRRKCSALKAEAACLADAQGQPVLAARSRRGLGEAVGAYPAEDVAERASCCPTRR